MKRNVCRIGSAAVCAALCLTLGCSCSVLPPASGKPAAPASSVPTDAHGDPLYDSSRLDDGKLRMLYGYDNSGGACTVLCGSKPQASRGCTRAAALHHSSGAHGRARTTAARIHPPDH